MQKIKPVEPITSTSFQNNPAPQNQKQFEQTILCALFGNSVCPKPTECDGINRKCTFWQNHSGR